MKLFQVRHDDGVTLGHGPQEFGMLFGWRCFAEDFAAGKTLRGAAASVETVSIADTRDGARTINDARNLGALRAWFGRIGLPWSPRVGPWTLDDDCALATFRRQDETNLDYVVTVSRTQSGDIYIYDSRTYYPSGGYRLPQELLDMLQPSEVPEAAEDYEG